MESRSDSELPDEQSTVKGFFVELPHAAETRKLDILSVFRNASAFKGTAALVLLSCVAIGALTAFVQEPVFRSEVLLSPASPIQKDVGLMSSQLGGLAALAGVRIGDDDNVQRNLAVLVSRSFTLDFIREENLMPILFADHWDTQNQTWKSSNPDKVPTFADAFELFDEDVRSISQDKRTGLVTLSIDWSDRQLAAAWANKMVDRLNRYIRNRDINEAEASANFLTQQLDRTNNIELRQGISRSIQAQIETIMLANVRAEYAMQVIDPAVVSDADDFVSPNRILIIAIAIITGLFLAVLAVIFRVLVANGMKPLVSD